MQSIYTAKLGLKAQQQRMDIVASNIANSGTTGYKSQRAGFKDALYTQMIDPSDTASTANLKQGGGVLLSSTYRDFAAGTPVLTGEPLDLYIEGDGFFTLERGGEVLYTRCGNFGISSESGERYIVTTDGDYLLDAEGNRIVFPTGSDDISVSENGELYSDGTQFAVLGLVTFPNKDGLAQVGNSLYAQTDVSGNATESGATLRQGYIESSNVDLTVEISQMMRAQRVFSLAGRALSAWDEMESTTNNLRA